MCSLNYSIIFGLYRKSLSKLNFNRFEILTLIEFQYGEKKFGHLYNIEFAF